MQGANEVQSYQQPLNEFYQLVLNNEEMKLNEWRIRLREERLNSTLTNEDAFVSYVSEWKESGWEQKALITDGTEWKAHFTYDRPDGITESIQFFAYPTPNMKNGLSQLITYEVLGTNGSVVESNIVDELVEERSRDLELHDATTYVQIQVSDRSNMNDIEKKATKWIQQLSAEPVEALKEDSFVSYSAYNPDWNSFIETNGQRMNIQVAIRENQRLGAGTTVTIGTPIITTEY
ncbi:YwmB family TATA-box binding protein [Halalkalibacter akibai]|uniref:TATA-box binding n=1 Tax=Halalkalibacter akibai (strain ATCC 43226 / DSM 21942 / CIP 109018 / JCM 9157 / 1139) TaxID=1236973 RepID=W4QNF4_HALA3|nr:YwmB family TATA-box binding protein [Halalkalibacter akibai]GAE33645.1 hypothetical protein JCM9157_664 [Halalkalibacter akibai JCM 9157]